MATLPKVDEPKCGNCKYYKAVFAECRRHAPIAVPREADSTYTTFPSITDTEWCGDHEPNAELAFQRIQRENAEDIT